MRDIASWTQENIAGNKYSQDYAEDIGIAQFVSYLSQGQILSWRGHAFHSPDELSRMMWHAKNNDINDIYLLLRTPLLLSWIDDLGLSGMVKDELNRVLSMAEKTAMGLQVAYCWLAYMFRENRSDNEYAGCSNIDSLSAFLMDSPAHLYAMDGDYCIVEYPPLLGFLCSLGYDEAIESFISDSYIDYYRNFDMFFDFLENNVEQDVSRKRIRNSYADFGPRAYLLWWQQHLDDYTFSGATMEIYHQAKAIAINPDANLATQRTGFSTLQQMYNEFTKHFRFNFLMGLAGIRRLFSNDYIYSGKLSCLLEYN